MKERPILFSAPMVRAILDGSKTQTRRIVKPPKGGTVIGFGGNGIAMASLGMVDDCEHITTVSCPYGKIGDRLWVREAWRTDAELNNAKPRTFFSWPVRYEADGAVFGHGAFFGKPTGKLRPSIFMPRWASRLAMEITGIRVERLNDISKAYVEAEGIEFLRRAPDADETLTAKELYLCLWDAINGNGSRAANPWVWVVEFKKIEGGA